ncbi:hypothetical protein [Stackebrandtia soli]|uniref:hypothetical protein n=1 Tax=Stackebrandtia soli TaxID=1892856 RepID=UPI0039E891B7
MSKTAPGRVAGIAFGAAVMTALAQLGLASGLAVLIWRDGDVAEWAAHLAWTSWLTAVSTVVGGFAASRLASDTAAKIAAVPSAAVGGFVVAPLVAIPAMRFADAPLSAAPFQAAGIGAVIGMVVIAVSLASRAVAVNVAASIVLTWVLAGLSAFVPIGDTGDTIRPGVWGSWRDLVGTLGEGSLSVAPPLLLGSLVIGAAAAAATADKGGDHRVTAVSGAFGPLLLVLGYASASQAAVGVSPQWPGIFTGIYAAVAGLLGSLLVAAFRRSPQPAKPAPTATLEPVEPELPPQSSTVQVPAIDPYVSEEYGWDEPARVPRQRDAHVMPSPPPGPEYGVGDDEVTAQWVSDLKREDTLFDERGDNDAAEPEKPKKAKRKPRKKKDED